MLNYYYIYSVLWGITLALYLLGWSGLNSRLDPVLVFFFLSTIILSLLLGHRASDRYRYKKSDLHSVRWNMVIILIICSIIALLQLGYIPVLDYFTSTVDYEQLREADKSIFNTIAIVGSVFCSVYQYLVWYERRTNESFLKLLIFIFILVLFSSRGPLMVCLLCFAAITIGNKKTKFTIKLALLIPVLIGLSLILFGIIGNLRVGSRWNDSSFIYSIGEFEGYWPNSLPKELCWTYSYITSPLANLNYSLNYRVDIDILNYIYDFLPMMISKRLPLYIAPKSPLQVSYFTVSSVWSDYFQHLSYMGIFFGYINQMIILDFLNTYSSNTPYKVLTNVFSSECVAFSFFVNSFVYPTMGYPLVILFVLSYIYKNRKDVKGNPTRYHRK